MSNKPLIAAWLLAFSVPAFAQTEPTFADIASANRELKYQELRNKLSEAKAKSAPASALPASALPPQAPVPLPSPIAMPSGRASVPEPSVEQAAPSKPQLVAIYGIGNRLSAEIQYNGSTHTVRTGGDPSLGDWTVETITPFTVVVTKPGAKGKKGADTAPVRQTLHLASEPAADPTAGQNSASRRQTTGGMDFSSMASPFGGSGMPRMPVPQLPAPPAAR